jgi:DNA-binding HxlR family transcriptional regulator
MRRTHTKVGYPPKSKPRECSKPSDVPECTPDVLAEALKLLEGRWKMVIIHNLFQHGVLRFSELERAIPGVSQKMLIQQLRELERVGIVYRTVFPQIPPKVEYGLTAIGRNAPE